MNDIFNKAFKQKSTKPFIVFGDTKVTFGELKKCIRKYSTYFHRMGINAGERIVFSSKNESFTCTFYLSLVANGITVISIDPDCGAERALAIINHCQSKFVFVDSQIQTKWHLCGDEERQIIPVNTQTKEDLIHKLIGKETKATQLLPTFAESLPESDFIFPSQPDADAYILFTSGTTSAPKGVRISYRALFSHLETLSAVYQLNHDSRLFNNLILSHADGMIQGPLLAFYNSATLYRPFAFTIQRIEDIFDIIYRENIAHWVMVPTMIGLIFQMKQKDPDTLHGRQFRYVISCGGKLEALLWQQFEEKFKTRIINSYGLTETVAGGLFAGPGDESHIIGTIGKPVDCEAKIMDDNHQEQPIGAQGEIWLRGTLIMSGYLDQPKESKDAFEGEWLKTGDIGYKGTDGCYRITGRKKLVIISGGLNISPEEVTEVLHSHPAVTDAVTFGIEEKIWGEIVACAIVLKEESKITSEDIIAYCRLHMEERKVPTKVYFVDELPYGNSGKVIIQDVIEKVSRAVETEDLPKETLSGFTRIVSECFQILPDVVSMEMSADDTPAWDSLSYLTLIARIEKHFTIEFSPLEVMKVKTLSDLFLLVEKKING